MIPLEKSLIALLAAAILTVGCSRANPPPQAAVPTEPTLTIPAKTDPAQTPVPKPLEQIVRQQWTPNSPEARAQAFYDWYMNYARSKGNVTADGAYRNSEYLYPEWIAKVDAKIKEWKETNQPGFDPFACAQDFADEVIAGPADIVGTEAALMAYHGRWGGPKVWSEMEIYLTMYNNQWRIVRIVCRR